MIGPGRAGYSPQPMRLKAALLLVFGALALVAAGCGGEETAPLPDEVEGETPADTTPTETAEEEPAEEEPAEEEPAEEPAEGEGDPQAGLEVFASAGCGGCHTLQEANASGTVGPSFDDTETDYETAVDTITHGRGAMPAFADQLSEQEIRDVAALVSDS